MKFITTGIFVIFLVSVTNAQLTKKTWLTGGSGSLYSYKDAFTSTGQQTVTSKLTEVTLSANLGYFLIDKFAAGVKTSINSLKSRELNSASSGTKDITFTVGPFARYYFLQAEKEYNLFLDGAFQFGPHSSFAGKGTAQNASISFGTEIFFNTAVGIEFLVGYLHRDKRIENAQPGFTNTRNGINISVGFQFHLTN